MKKQKFEVDQVVKMPCSACDDEVDHTVKSVTKLGKLTKAMCDTCETLSTFRRGKKVSVDITKAKAGAPYEFSQKSARDKRLCILLLVRAKLRK